ncbi:vitamin B12 ABC transporter ATP-binding protein BtuD [Vibrio mangrovi]|uniref:Vitamin B12 import ATP-binding protein BtuD n=1 Tax=Vibrio mangrovi TaxID=474394 RepID=A0A1Y6IQ95_9VIBR|nr:vitamin B12 ABC transporter ATP-binding protein BtuD [Vibrio mangrovi]MDW6004231.1 vitamin B12 ABC transporter ATP-binding protein BtuD [Vibrio mangrovi]SMR98970.1 Vitamin B12 import ATP-binding protein BtuD [Vibrio mangrovi]
MIHVRDLSVGTRLLPLSFDCAQGELIHVVGPNGSGKSTLLTALAGMIPYRGNIQLGETDLTHLSLPALAQLRAYLSQHERPAFSIDVYQYLALSIPSVLPVTQEKSSVVIQELVQRLNLQDKLHRSIHQISGGEWQRVRLAGSCLQIWPTLNPHARLMILDEPAAALDVGQEYMLYELLQDVNSMGITVIMANHDLNRTLRYADKTLLLNQGILQQWGDTRSVLAPEHVADVFRTQVQSVEIQGKSYLLFD